MRVWEASTGHELSVVSGIAGEVYSAEFSPDGRFILTTDKTTVHVETCEECKPITELLKLIPNYVSAQSWEMESSFSHSSSKRALR